MVDPALDQVLLAHHARYPHMQAQDWVKLAYQAAYGPAHAQVDEPRLVDRLQAEAAGLPEYIDPDHPVFEPIGNGLARLHLAAVRTGQLTAQTLHRLFVHTAETVGASASLYDQYLNRASQLLLADPASVPTAHALSRWLQDTDGQKPRPVSHSDHYRIRYQPAYRVVLQAFEPLLPLFAAVEQLRPDQRPFLVAIDGPSCSGKTSLTALLHKLFGGPVIRMDHFFLRPGQASSARLREVGGNIDRERFQRVVVAPLKKGLPVTYRPYDCRSGRLLAPRIIRPEPVIWVEGVYSQHPIWADAFSFKLFLTVSAQQQLQRLQARESPAMLRRFVTEWLPLEKQYFESWGIQKKAHLILPAWSG